MTTFQIKLALLSMLCEQNNGQDLDKLYGAALVMYDWVMEEVEVEEETSGGTVSPLYPVQ